MPVIGVAGKPTERTKADLGPAGISALESRASDEGCFLWPRRKAFADGGGRGTTSWGGVDDFLGGDVLRAHGLGLTSLGGET